MWNSVMDSTIPPQNHTKSTISVHVERLASFFQCKFERFWMHGAWNGVVMKDKAILKELLPFRFQRFFPEVCLRFHGSSTLGLFWDHMSGPLSL